VQRATSNNAHEQQDRKIDIYTQYTTTNTNDTCFSVFVIENIVGTCI
jgi:hypothetical protein